jgi:hypothetical protein
MYGSMVLSCLGAGLHSAEALSDGDFPVRVCKSASPWRVGYFLYPYVNFGGIDILPPSFTPLLNFALILLFLSEFLALRPKFDILDVRR